MPYEKLPITNLPFKFTDSGYQLPDFEDLPFRFGLRPTTAQTAQLQGAIDVMKLYQTSTYTYLKECPTIITGYGTHGVQILRLPCIYGGIRDLGSTLLTLPPNVDLPAYIFANKYFTDLIAYINIVNRDNKDLSSTLWSYQVGSPKDLSGYLWPYFFGNVNLAGLLHGWDETNLGAYIDLIPGINLLAILNVIEIRNLPGFIVGEWWHGYADLNAVIPKIFQRPLANLSASMHGWAEFFLQAYLNPMQPKDLNAYIFSGTFNTPKDLSAFIMSNPLGELQGIIHGWDMYHLPAYIIGGFSPSDLQAAIYGTASINFPAYIAGFGGVQVPFNLRASVEAFFITNLSASIGLIHPFNLNATLIAYGKTLDLAAQIVPKTILIRRSIQVALLEHINLSAYINYMCGNSASVNLSAYLYAYMKKELGAIIWGWYGSTTDSILNLGAYINTGVYIVQDSLKPISFVGLSERLKFTKLDVYFNTDNYFTVFNRLPVYFGNLKKLNLGAYVDGILTAKNLSASLTPIFDWNYTDLPPWIIPKTHEVVLDIERMEEQWRRFIEIMFDNSAEDSNEDKNFVYFYVNGTQKVYRLDRDRHWTVWVKSYIKDDDDMIERRMVRYKYGFNMSKYTTIDEAVRDLIDRVSVYRHYNLPANIAVIDSVCKDLNVIIKVKPLYHWVKPLTGVVKGVATVYDNISASIEAI